METLYENCSETDLQEAVSGSRIVLGIPFIVATKNGCSVCICSTPN